MPPKELVVLLDDAFSPIGTADKATLHNHNTPLHLAFSCYVFNSQQQLLLTRRALHKIAWPGVWSNSFCGHPLPNEAFTAAVARRAGDELGLALQHIQPIFDEFSYYARDSNGIVEHEFCPIFAAQAAGEVNAVAAEVDQYQWVDFSQLLQAVEHQAFLFSPWMVQQLLHPNIARGLKDYQAQI